MLVQRYGQRHSSDKHSAGASLIGNSDRDREKHVYPFDDILRTFINEAKKEREQVRKDRAS